MPRSQFMLFRVDAQNLAAAIQVWYVELDLTIQTARAKQSRVKSVWSVSGHQHLNVATRVETVEFCHNLKHRPLDFVIG